MLHTFDVALGFVQGLIQHKHTKKQEVFININNVSFEFCCVLGVTVIPFKVHTRMNKE